MLLVLNILILSGAEPYVSIDSIDRDPGLFEQLGTVIGVLECYENKKYSGVKVDFGCDGFYYSPYKGSNWWEYYFKKIELGQTVGESRRIPNIEKALLSGCIYELSVARVHELIQKYIEVKPDIIAKVAECQKDFADAFVVGVYYWKYESSSFAAPKISYKKFYDALLVHLFEKRNLKIFVYTNDKRFYSFLKVKHPDIVLQYRKNVNSNAEKGECELINCLLLSKTNLLLCMPSRFSMTVSHFNPSLPVVEFGLSPAQKTEFE